MLVAEFARRITYFLSNLPIPTCKRCGFCRSLYNRTRYGGKGLSKLFMFGPAVIVIGSRLSGLLSIGEAVLITETWETRHSRATSGQFNTGIIAVIPLTFSNKKNSSLPQTTGCRLYDAVSIVHPSAEHQSESRPKCCTSSQLYIEKSKMQIRKCCR